MRTALRFLWALALSTTALRAAAIPGPSLEVTAAVQAIQQSADPSAAIAAFANGVAVDRNSAAVYEAYIARMIDFGLPEMAYRQAWSLTSLVSSNGLAWGVLAYVDARRGDMTNAVAALTLAAQFAPDRPFVQRTAGELLAWYDLKQDGTPLGPELRTRLDAIRTLLQNRPAFMTAYSAAKHAYQNNPPAPGQPLPGASGAAPVLPSSTPQAYVTPEPVLPPEASLEPYASPADSEPVWVDSDPAWWWDPVGVFAGASFVPFTYFVFDHHHSHHHRGGWGHNGSWHGGEPSWNHLWARGERDNGMWHRDQHGRSSFYALPAEPSRAIARTTPAVRPSWDNLTPPPTRRPVTLPSRRDEARPAVRNSTSLPTVRSSGPSWSSFDSLNRAPLYKSGAATLSTSPSWSILGRSSSGEVIHTPTIANPAPTLSLPSSPAPSWSALGRGAPAVSSGSASMRSSPAPALSRGAAPSWSTLSRKR